ncbi:MAG: hypothetical protein ACR2NP_03805 [Pirellulaceae bacterium]
MLHSGHPGNFLLSLILLTLTPGFPVDKTEQAKQDPLPDPTTHVGESLWSNVDGGWAHFQSVVKLHERWSDRTPADVATPPRSLTPKQDWRKQSISRCLALYYPKHVDADVLRPWSVMHGLIAYGRDTPVLVRGRKVNAADYLCANGIGDDRRILYVVNGKLGARTGRGVQGHEGQLLAMLAQAEVAADHSLTVDGHKLSVEDLIKYECRTCRAGTELTFKLIGLSYYLNTEATWKNDQGEIWSIGRLVEEELKQPINGESCGGTHRLMGLSRAVHHRREQGKSIDGHFLRAENFVRDYHDYALQMQNPDGSFSTSWLEKRENDRDAKQKLYTTGHILEWLAFSLPAERLEEPGVTRAVDFLVNLMLNAPGHELDVGPKGHSLHALRLYEKRVFGESDFRKHAPAQAVAHRSRSRNDSPASQNAARMRGRRVFGRR